ncbi:unnamed protein product [Caenorhabditis bovis]|uniref:TGF-beta family profile domain-containing protein n=1 Tax=Caenorhabditis bovis TaxID=2654633 RepID=A0A8S1EA52_9PELO|nr:unnamed protein product [Caenorhabditis bovis]
MQKVLIIVLICEKVFSKGIYFVEERNGVTYTQPLTSTSKAEVGEQIKDIFDIDLDDGDHNFKLPDKNGLISRYMKNLYDELENLENNGQMNEESLTPWLSADEIISVMAIDISDRHPDGVYQIKFSRKSLPDSKSHSVLCAQLRVTVSGLISPVFFTIDDSRIADENILVAHENPIVVTDVTPIISNWIEDISSETFINLHASTSSPLKLEAFIVIAVKDEAGKLPKTRNRRAVAASPLSFPQPKRQSRKGESAYFEKPERNEICQKKGLYVDFDALGWKQWVIAPEGFSAFYCAGACSAPFHRALNATSHAIVQSLVHLVRPNATTEAKCAPSSLSSMKIMFIDQKKNLLIKRYRDMVVKECGCH